MIAVASEIATNLLTSRWPSDLPGFDLLAATTGYSMVVITLDSSQVLAPLVEQLEGQVDSISAIDQMMLWEDCQFLFLGVDAPEDASIPADTVSEPPQAADTIRPRCAVVHNTSLCRRLGLLVGGGEHLVPAVFQVVSDGSVAWLDGSGALIGPGSCRVALYSIVKHCRGRRETFVRAATMLGRQLQRMERVGYFEWVAAGYLEFALKRKATATALFAAGEVAEACRQYQAALQVLRDIPHQPDSHNDQLCVPLLLNVTQCYLKLSKWMPAYASASAVLRLSPSSHKALYRRAMACVQLGLFAEAVDDLRAALELLGGCNRQVEALLHQALCCEDRTAVSSKQTCARQLHLALYHAEDSCMRSRRIASPDDGTSKLITELPAEVMVRVLSQCAGQVALLLGTGLTVRGAVVVPAVHEITENASKGLAEMLHRADLQLRVADGEHTTEVLKPVQQFLWLANERLRYTQQMTGLLRPLAFALHKSIQCRNAGTLLFAACEFGSAAQEYETGLDCVEGMGEPAFDMICSLHNNLAATMLRQNLPSCALQHAKAAAACARDGTAIMFRCIVLQARALVMADRVDDAVGVFKTEVVVGVRAPVWFKTEAKKTQEIAKLRARKVSEKFKKAYAQACEEEIGNGAVNSNNVINENVQTWVEQMQLLSVNQIGPPTKPNNDDVWGEIWDNTDFVE